MALGSPAGVNPKRESHHPHFVLPQPRTFCCDGAADQAGWYCDCGGHALYDVALNLVFLGLQYVTPGESVASRTRSKKSA